jgi:hypothetical protein
VCLGVVRRIADEVAVLYAGQIVEQGGNVNPYTGVANNRFWRKADDDRWKRGLVIRLFAIDNYPALFDHAISKQRKIRNDFSARVTWRLLC